MAKKLTDAEARKIMKASGFVPLVQYQSSMTPWLSKCIKCKREVSPSLNNVKTKGVNCGYCSGNIVHSEDAVKLMKKANLEPLSEFPGASKAWECECLRCGKIVNPSYKSVRTNGAGCKYCGRIKAANSNRIDEVEAIKLMKAVGLLPLEPYVSSGKPWKSKCMKCKREVTPRLSMVKSKKSGCTYCAGVRVDEEDALKMLKKLKLKPLEPYQGNKHPWKCIHLPCGKTVSPRYNGLQKGQGPCKYCAHKAVDPKDAIAIFVSKDLQPLDPYPGDNKKPWRSIHLVCGNEVFPIYDVVRRGESMGCHFCSDQFVDPNEAFNFMVEKGFQPLVPYPGSPKAWKSIHLACGSNARPSFGKIKSGRIGCPTCSGNLKITQERAYSFFRSKNLEPLEKFHGPHHPWKSIHTECGKEVSPRWASVQQGQNGCKYCAGAAVDTKDARALFEKMGLNPLEQFPGASKPWKSIHIKCGREVSPRYSGLRAGQGPCRYCAGLFVDPEEALALFRSRGLEPQVPYPGASIGWESVHKVCKRKVKPTYGYVKMGGVGCNFCAGLEPISPKVVEKLFISRGFKPLDEYRNGKTPIRAIHKVCGREVQPLYSSIKNGGGCKYCAIGGINLAAPAFLYLMTHDEYGSHKIGIGGYESNTNRIDQHRKHGWKLFKSLDFVTAEIAYEVEQAILNWLRHDLGIPQYLVLEQMPQGGHSETVDASEIDLVTIWAKVQELRSIRT